MNRTSKPAESGPGADWFTLVAHAAFVIAGGGLLFAFAWSLLPAVAAQNAAPCRPLDPEARSGAAPDFTVQDLAGNRVSLADFRGKFLVLNFWATWCEPCTQEWPELDLLAQRLVAESGARREDVVIVALSVDQDRALIPEFLTGMGLSETPVRVLWDPSGKLHETYGSPKLPDTYFISPDGELLQVFVNVRDWGSPGAASCVESMLAP